MMCVPVGKTNVDVNAVGAAATQEGMEKVMHCPAHVVALKLTEVRRAGAEVE